ncbi:recombination regulator RecX [Eubacteriales bacterium OttesenSCG-928-A19]|nr:recombination regulator RecX [Eubacteriales bacterium OttesenSCG-928-A19]
MGSEAGASQPAMNGEDRAHADEVQRALDRALRALALRAHSEQEIVDKLTRAGYDEHIIAETMAKLSEYSLTDDPSFASQWANSRARRGMGPWRIARELREKGVSREDADAAIAELDQDAALDTAIQLAEKQLRKGDARAQRRAYETLIRRGYDYDMAREALRTAGANLEEEDE